MEQIFFEQYEIKGISIDNIEDVYNTRLTGLGDMTQTRDHLISKGMSGSFADYLARRYINKVERDSDIYSIMDFFDHRKNADAAKALHDTSMPDMTLNYKTLNEYTHALNQREALKKFNYLRSGRQHNLN